MVGEKLHQFDLHLCQYALDNVRGHLGDPAFAAYVEDQLDPPVLAYLRALGGDGDPAPLLLLNRDLEELAETFAGGPFEFDRPWVPYEPLHRNSIDSVVEIRDGLAGAYAEAWARASAGFAERLERSRTRLGDGIEIVRDWVAEARRLLRAMGATALLPHPEGAFPTPAHPEASPLPLVSSGRHDESRDDDLRAMIAETQALQREVRDLLLSQRTVKDFYTTAEVSAMLGKAEFTVREWCRHGRVHAQKQGSGRGKHQSWVIAHEELQRLQREGLLPASEPG